MGCELMISKKAKDSAAVERTAQEDRIAVLEAELTKLRGETRATRHRQVTRLSERVIQTVKRDGFYADGSNLYLDVELPSRRFVFRWKRNGKSRDYSIGLWPVITLAAAREKALSLRRMVAEGRDPIEERRAGKLAAKLETAKAMTFRQCAEAYVAAHEQAWRSDVHRRQWITTLETYVYPIIGTLPVQAVDVGLVMKVIEPHWQDRTETMSRIRGRIEVILDWAKVRGYRQGENPARWRGHLDALLPAKAKLQPVKHLAAMAYAELPALMAELDHPNASIAEMGLRFTILTACRTGEVLGARWSEIDGEARLWLVPPDRMKARRERKHAASTGSPSASPLRRFWIPSNAYHRPRSCFRRIACGRSAARACGRWSKDSVSRQPCMGFAARSPIGVPSARIIRPSAVSWRSRIRSEVRSRDPTGEPTCSIGAGS
jgi:hypothetical protein